jgi:hypothetical protein
MELKDKILKNREKFEKTNKIHNILNDGLLKFLGEDLFTAPASNMESMYNAYPGGLIDHILKVTKYTLFLNDSLPENIRLKKESIIKVCFLHQIGKTKLFKFCESEWHRKNTGKVYDFNEELISMRVGERSAYYALSYGVELTEEEYQSIINFDKPDDDKQSKWYGSILSTILRQGNELSIIECKNNK